MQPTTDNYKVKLVSAADKADSTIESSRKKIVVFQATPELTESRTANYSQISPVHAPGQFYVYTNTQSRQYSLSSVKLISRTSAEARNNIERLNTLRGWLMPYFGSTSVTGMLSALQTSQQVLSKRLGAPPEVLLLSAYSSSTTSGTFTGNVNRVPVVITSLTIPYSSETDYIPTAFRYDNDPLGGVPFPVIMSLDIQLSETHSPYEYSGFNLSKYQAGVLDSF